MYDSILVPTDGSNHALRAATHAGRLADRFDAGIHVLSVVDTDAAAGPFSAGGIDDGFVERLEADAESMLDAVDAALADDTPVTTTYRRGRPVESILNYAESCEADLLAMGTHGRTGVRRIVAGSVTEAVLRQSPVPVLTARATESDPPETYDAILLPTDGSEATETAVTCGVDLADAFDAHLHVVYVADTGVLGPHAGATYSTPTLKTLREAGTEAVEAVLDRAREVGVEATGTVQDGHPGSDLLSYTDERGIDLITMGTTGQTGLARYVLGSTTEHMIRHAEKPVVAINAAEHAD